MRGCMSINSAKMLRVVDHDINSIRGYRTVGVNPNSFFSAEPYVLHEYIPNLDPRTPPAGRSRRVDLVRIQFFQGNGFREYDVDPDEACRFLGFCVKEEAR